MEDTTQATNVTPTKDQPIVEDQPGFTHAHDESKQITGQFDRLSVTKKPKIKTRGEATLTTNDQTTTPNTVEV